MPGGKFHVKREVSLDSNGKNPDKRGMDTPVEITADAVRQTLIARATAFSEAHGYSFSRIGDEALADSKFLARVRAGDNFTIKTYQRVIDWIDDADIRLAPKASAA